MAKESKTIPLDTPVDNQQKPEAKQKPEEGSKVADVVDAVVDGAIAGMAIDSLFG